MALFGYTIVLILGFLSQAGAAYLQSTYSLITILSKDEISDTWLQCSR